LIDHQFGYADPQRMLSIDTLNPQYIAILVAKFGACKSAAVDGK
jgi:hypothetical protein